MFVWSLHVADEHKNNLRSLCSSTNEISRRFHHHHTLSSQKCNDSPPQPTATHIPINPLVISSFIFRTGTLSKTNFSTIVIFTKNSSSQAQTTAYSRIPASAAKEEHKLIGFFSWTLQCQWSKLKITSNFICRRISSNWKVVFEPREFLLQPSHLAEIRGKTK